MIAHTLLLAVGSMGPTVPGAGSPSAPPIHVPATTTEAGSPPQGTPAPALSQDAPAAPLPADPIPARDDRPERKQRQTFAPNNNGDDSSQGQLTQNRNVSPSRFNVRNKPVPSFPNPYPAAAQGNGPRAGPYFFSRWAEDWSSLRDRPPGKNDFFDPLKFIPLAGAGEVYLTLSGESRARLNFVTNPRLIDAPAEEQYLLRNIAGADLHLGRHVRVYGELANGAAFGSPGVDGSAMQQNDLVVQQLFAEATVPIGTAQIAMRLGRQEFMDGPPNVIHIRPAPNIYTSLDGVRVNVSTRRFRASLFNFKSVALGAGAFDDPTNDRERFRGVTTSFVLPQIDALGSKSKLFFDPFVWNHRNEDRRWGPVTATDDRNFYGARLWGTAGNATLDLSVIRQDGRFDNRPISAWGLFANGGYLLNDGAWHPRIGAHFDYTSGGGAYTGGTLKSFDFFYGSIPYFSWGNLIGPSNLADASVNVRFTPIPRVSVTTEYSMLRRVNQNDAVYNFLGSPFPRTQLVPGHSIGSLFKADIAWQANPHLLVALKMDFLIAGPVLESAGYANSTFFGPEVQFRF